MGIISMLLGEDAPDTVFSTEHALGSGMACLHDADRYSCDQHGMTCSGLVSCS